MGKLKGAPEDLRPLRQAAMAGDHSAARTLLRLYGDDQLAREIKRNFPFPPRVKKMIDVLTAGTGVGDELGPWEVREADGTIINEIQFPPSPPRRARARATNFEEQDQC